MSRRRLLLPFASAHPRSGLVLATAALVLGIAATTAAATSTKSSAASRNAVSQTAAKADWKAVPRTLAARVQALDREAPKPPSGLRVTATTSTTIATSWNAARDNMGVTGYGVYVNGARVASTTARSYKAAGLRCGTTYRVGVDAVDAAGNRSAIASVLAATAPCLDTAAPSAPADLRQTGWSQTGAGIDWHPATDNVSVAGYSVFRDGVPVAVTQQQGAWVGGLVCGSSHTVGVEAFDAAGNHSARTPVVVTTSACADTAAPTAPASLAVTGSTASSISVAWQPATDNRGVVEYRTSIDGVQVATTSSTNASFSGLACGRSYTIGVVAADAAGNVSPSAAIAAPTTVCPSSGADTQAPTAPTGLTRLEATPTSVTLSWKPATDNVGIAGYGVYRGTTKIADPKATAHQVTGLACATSYTLAVDAVDSAGNRSPRAAIVAATAPCEDNQPPTSPSGLTSSAKTETTISIAWQPSVDPNGVEGYRVFRDGTLVGTTVAPSYTVTGLRCGMSYTLSVEAYDAAGNHSERPATIATTAACSDWSAPSAPTAFAKTGSTATGISVSWAAATDDVGVTGYSLHLAGSQVGTTSQTTYTFPGLACGTSYTLGVEAFDAAGNRSPRAALTAATAACAPAPAPGTPTTGTVYVAPTGSDSNPCTQAQPCRSFGRAYKVAAPGATVLVAAGTYASQEISLDSAKSSTAPVVFEPAGGAVTVNGTIDFGQDQFNRLGPRGVTVRNMTVSYLRLWPGTEDMLFENIDAAHIDITGVNIVVRGGDYGPCQAPRDDPACVSRIAGYAKNVLVEGASFHDVTSTDLVKYHVDGMAIFGGENITIRENKFYGNMITNIRVQNCCGNPPVKNLTLENNWFAPPLQGDGVTPRGDGIDVDNPIPGLLIRHNSFAEGTGPQLVGDYAGTGASLVGNLFTNALCAPGVRYAYNVFIPFSPYTGQSACGSTDKKVATFQYVAPAASDFHLMSTSPALNAVLGSECAAADIDKEPRPASGCDAGADER